MKFTKSAKLDEAVRGEVSFDKEMRGTASYATADAVTEVEDARKRVADALAKQAKDAEGGIDNMEEDRHRNHRLSALNRDGLSHPIVESVDDEDEALELWDKLYGALTMDGKMVKKPGAKWATSNMGLGYSYDDVGVSPIYDEGVRVWGETEEDLKPAEDAARELGLFEIVRKYDTYASGPKKWRVDIRTIPKGE